MLDSLESMDCRESARRQWLASLKVGDEVALHDGLFDSVEGIHTVSQIDDAGDIVVEYDGKMHWFSPIEGIELSCLPRKQHTCGDYITPVTEPARQQVWRETATRRLNGLHWHVYDDATLAAVIALLDAVPRR